MSNKRHDTGLQGTVLLGLVLELMKHLQTMYMQPLPHSDEGAACHVDA